MQRLFGQLILGMWLMASLAGCDNYSFNMASVSNQFSQSVSVNNKVDIIWVVDGSGTMANHQENLAQNFEGFIQQFRDKGFDFNMVVTSTDAWVREFNYNAGGCNYVGAPWYEPNGPNPTNDPHELYRSSADCRMTLASWWDLTTFRDGDIYGTHPGDNELWEPGEPGVRSGKYIISSEMDDEELSEVFKINVKTGVRGDGVREATLQSLRSVLRRNSDGSPAYGGETHTVLNQFRRPDAFLAVITVTDEEDQSLKQDSFSVYENAEEYVQDFLGFLDGYTGVTDPGDRRYSVSGIILEDLQTCPYDLHEQVSEGHYYMAVAEATRGVTGNICSPDFYKDLQDIADKVITLATRFQIGSQPALSSIKVLVDGELIPKGDENGWTYVAENGNHYIEFNGSAVPSENAVIAVDYTPVTLR
jgi:hypothetical protein